MATYQEKIRTKLQSKVFDRIGKTATYKTKSSPLYNSRGEEESQSYTSSTITLVLYDITDSRRNYQPFGNLIDGEMAAAIPYTTTVGIGDLIVVEGYTWEVSEISMNYLPDNTVTIARIVRRGVAEAQTLLDSEGVTLLDSDSVTLVVAS